MTDNTVKVKVTDHHFKNSFSVGEKTVGTEPEEVEVNQTIRNGVQAGTLELIEGTLAPQRDEKSFQGDEQSGEESEEADDEELEEMTVDELREMAEDRGLKKSGTKDELISRIKEDR